MSDKEIKSMFDDLLKNESNLNQSQMSFIGSLKKYFNRYKKLSDKQIFILTEIKKYMQEKQVSPDLLSVNMTKQECFNE